MDPLSWVRMTLAIVILSAASISDLRTRTASDVNWYILGLGGSAIFAYQMFDEGAIWMDMVGLLLLTLVFVDLLIDRKGILEDGLNVPPLLLYVVTAAFMIWLTVDDWYNGRSMTVPVIAFMFVLYFLLYQFDVIKGGADAKALLALTLLFPVYPHFDGFPLLSLSNLAVQEAVPFSLLVMFNAAVLTIILPLTFLIINALRRDVRFPLMLFGYTMETKQAKASHVWPMEMVREGKIVSQLFPRSDEDVGKEYEMLEKVGKNRVWVTPKVPFLIPITLAVPFSALVGNVIFYLISG